MLLLQVQTDMAGGVPRGPDRAQPAARQIEEFTGDDLPVRRRGENRGSSRPPAAAARSGATCSRGAPAAVSLAAMYAYHRSGRASRVLRTIAASAACIATHAPDASRTRPHSPWWSGW